MSWSKKTLWNIGVAGGGALFLLMCLVLIPLSVVSAHEKISGLATPGTVTMQATPTEDATVTTLNKEKLAQEVLQLKEQNEPNLFGWLRTNASILLSTLVVVIGGLIGLWRWLGDRRDAQDKELKNQQNEREKRAEERFQAAVTGLGDEKEGARIGAAILLRTFLRPGYESFYTQTFDLAVANLRLPRSAHLPEDPATLLPLTTLGQALIVVFKEAFPLARDRLLKENSSQFSPTSLDASHILLDNAYLSYENLKRAWMPQASLRKADLLGANLSGANLSGADLSNANLIRTNLSGADLSNANLSGAKFSLTNFSGTDLFAANLSGTDFNGTDLFAAHELACINLRGVKGLTKKQLEACKAQGAIIDEDLATSSFQVTVASSSPPPQSNDAQTSSAPPAQESTPPSNPDGSNITSPQSDPEAGS